MESEKTVARRLRSRSGFTLIEIMVVIVILGLLAALVVPKLIGRTEEAKKTQARVQIRNIEQALGLFKLDNGFYPTTDQGIEALIRIPDAGRVPKNYRKDGYMDRWIVYGKVDGAQLFSAKELTVEISDKSVVSEPAAVTRRSAG